jgi:hypothetical protein
MNRKGFFKSLGVLVASALVAKPIINALAAPDTISCGKGLLWHIEQYGVRMTYKESITREEFRNLYVNEGPYRTYEHEFTPEKVRDLIKSSIKSH